MCSHHWSVTGTGLHPTPNPHLDNPPQAVSRCRWPVQMRKRHSSRNDPCRFRQGASGNYRLASGATQDPGHQGGGNHPIDRGSVRGADGAVGAARPGGRVTGRDHGNRRCEAVSIRVTPNEWSRCRAHRCLQQAPDVEGLPIDLQVRSGIEISGVPVGGACRCAPDRRCTRRGMRLPIEPLPVQDDGCAVVWAPVTNSGP